MKCYFSVATEFLLPCGKVRKRMFEFCNTETVHVTVNPYIVIIISTQQSPFWQADTCASCYEIQCTLRKPEVRCRVHNMPPFVRIQSVEFTPPHPVSFTFTLILFFRQCQCPASYLFSSDFPTKVCMDFSTLPASSTRSL